MVDPDFEILWRKVAEAYNEVRSNATRSVEFEHNGYRVQVYHGQPTRQSKAAIYVVVNDDVESKPPTLISP